MSTLSVTNLKHESASGNNITLASDGTAAFAEIITASKGVKFPGTAVASADPNTLDDYEEGTFTPQYVAASGTAVTGSGHGRYTKIGNLITVHIIINGGPGTGSGELSISVPFTAVGYGGYGTGHTAINGQTWSWGTDSPKSAYAKNNTAVISFWDAGTNLITCSDMAASGNNIEFFLTYEAA